MPGLAYLKPTRSNPSGVDQLLHFRRRVGKIAHIGQPLALPHEIWAKCVLALKVELAACATDKDVKLIRASAERAEHPCFNKLVFRLYAWLLFSLSVPLLSYLVLRKLLPDGMLVCSTYRIYMSRSTYVPNPTVCSFTSTCMQDYYHRGRGRSVLTAAGELGTVIWAVLC